MVDCSYTDPSSWGGEVNGIPYRLVSAEGTFAEENGTAQEIFLVQASQLVDFAVSVLPDVQVISGIPVWVPGWTLYGAFDSQDSGLYAQEVQWRTHVPGKPIDPFGKWNAVNLSAPKTFHDVLEVTVIYKPIPPEAKTFLTFQARASSELIHVSTPSGDIQSAREANDIVPGTNPNRDPTQPVMVQVPITQWTITWHRLPRTIWLSNVYGTVRSLLGKVNSAAMPTLFNAPPGTILFTGFDFEETWSWRGLSARQANWGNPATLNDLTPVRVNFMFKEKHIQVDAPDPAPAGAVDVHGHNSIFKPTEGGWKKITINDDADLIYQEADLNTIFFHLDEEGDA